MDPVKCDKPGCDGYILPDTAGGMTAQCPKCGGSTGTLESEEDDAKRRMLDTLDTFKRKVMTDEISGIVMVAQCFDGYVLHHLIGEPPSPEGILIMERIASDATDIFLDRNDVEDDGKPRLRAAEKEEE